jgi:small subunit ribosomal protein S18
MPKKNFFSNSPNKSLIKSAPQKGSMYNQSNKYSTKKGNTNKPIKFNHAKHAAQSKLKLKKNLKIKRVLSLSQILGRIRQQRQKKLDQQKRQKPIKPIIPPKSLIIILKDKPEKAVYNRRIIDYKHCGLLQRYIGLGGKILPRRQTRLTAKQQRYVAKTIKSARIMGLLPFVSKERGFFR